VVNLLKLEDEEQNLIMKLTNFPSIPEECTKAIEIYREYKRLKRILGKPERYPLDPEKTIEDLSSDKFFMIEDIDKLKNPYSI